MKLNVIFFKNKLFKVILLLYSFSIFYIIYEIIYIYRSFSPFIIMLLIIVGVEFSNDLLHTSIFVRRVEMYSFLCSETVKNHN